MSFPIQKTPDEWKRVLTEKEYEVIRLKDTERPGATSEYNDFEPKSGYFGCKACGNPLYSAAAKFRSGCGWPAFDKCYTGSIKTNVDNSLRTTRTEIVCNKCGGHLGHVFSGERYTNTNERHCVNSVSVKYHKEDPPTKLTEEPVL